MKNYLSLLLVFLLLLPGCRRSAEDGENTTGQTAETIARVTLAFLDENEESGTFTWYLEPSDVDSYIKDWYKLEDLNLLDGAIARAEGARAFELAVLQVDETDVETVTAALQTYLADRRASFTGYLPDQADLVDRAVILTKGGWIALVVCQNQESTHFGFENCFGTGVYVRGIPSVLGPKPEDYRPDGRLVYTVPGEEDMTLFDSSAILSAWKSGNDSTLSKRDKAVLNAAKEVFDQWVGSAASDYDKESAIYAWLTSQVKYDHSIYDKQGAPRTSYEPYGPLVNGKGVCLGYAETFRLLMDMADIECITVTGAAYMNRESHAWNMVKLNGTWYCVDATWDQQSFKGDSQRYWELNLDQYRNYFNVTSDYMAQTDHQWDYDNTPEATAEDFGRLSVSAFSPAPGPRESAWNSSKDILSGISTS